MGAVDPKTSDDATTRDEDDHTIVVDRKAARAAKPKPQTTGLDEDDHTVVVENGDRALPTSPRASTKRKSGIAPPPVPSGFAPRAVEAAGANSAERYRPRAIPAPPSPSPMVTDGPAATREASATMPSVARRARITARVAVVVFAVSCVASVVGLTLIALALFARR